MHAAKGKRPAEEKQSATMSREQLRRRLTAQIEADRSRTICLQQPPAYQSPKRHREGMLLPPMYRLHKRPRDERQRFSGAADGTNSDGYREASATCQALGASSASASLLTSQAQAAGRTTRCGQGSSSDPLCPLLLPGMANYECDCSGHSQTPLPQEVTFLQGDSELGAL